MAKRIESTISAGYPWLVLLSSKEIIGFAYACCWKEREAYNKTVETTVYLHRNTIAQGNGTALYSQLFKELSNAGFHVAISCIALPNQGSINLHQKFGFDRVGTFSEVGYKFGNWVDIEYWQKRLT